ncbi:MAG: type II toxin-antitoxin system Phd/YefM family antitoxin [Magnetococcales bacterium]|nr:type II toxin-antitoxin system Phd/YefM family antitoxin [Magnetococcales bacterium]MBF0157296.1 type II toxin-antitoxin system Phd/YefM family antitoxin [Magnetococcales bacterium]
MNVIEDIRPLTEFKRDTAHFVARLRETGRPAVLTVNGKPALVVMDAEAWQETQDRIEYVRTVTAIRQGLLQARAGHGMEAVAFFESPGLQGV